MINTKQQIDDYLSDFGAPKQERTVEIEEPKVEEVETVELSPVEIYAKMMTDFERSRL